MSNKEIEALLKQQKIYKWQVAKKLGMHETSFIRWFREELSQKQVQQIVLAIEDIKKERLQKE